MTGEGEIEGVDDGRFGNDSSVVIIRGSVNLVIVGESVSRGEFSTGEDLPNDVEVLQEERPSGLPARMFTGVLKVGQVLVIGDDGNRMRCTLNVLSPFSERKDDCKEFAVIDVVVLFGRAESMREVGTRMEITIGISLE